MGPPAIADVVLIPFPFSDLSVAKRRPAVVLANAGNGDWIMCMLTSNAYADATAIRIVQADLLRGTLASVSFARPARLFTANESLIAGFIGPLVRTTFDRVQEAVVKIIKP